LAHSFRVRPRVASQSACLTSNEHAAATDKRGTERQTQLAGLALVIDVNTLDDFPGCGVQHAQISVGGCGVNMGAGESGACQCGAAIADLLTPEFFPVGFQTAL